MIHINSINIFIYEVIHSLQISVKEKSFPCTYLSIADQ
jgi:hypothetical protein